MKLYARSNSYVKTFKLCGQIQSMVRVLSSPEKMMQLWQVSWSDHRDMF